MRTQNQTTQFLDAMFVVAAGYLSFWVSLKTTVPFTINIVALEVADIFAPYLAWADGLGEPFGLISMILIMLPFLTLILGMAFSPFFSTIYWMHRRSRW